MERVVVVFFNGVLFKSPFLIQVVFLSVNRQNISFVPLLKFQHIYSFICVLISGISLASPPCLSPFLMTQLGQISNRCLFLRDVTELISDRQGYFLINYLVSFSEEIQALSKALSGFHLAHWSCVYTVVLCHTCEQCPCVGVGSCSRSRLALPTQFWCHYFCFRPWNRCQRACVGRQ